MEVPAFVVYGTVGFLVALIFSGLFPDVHYILLNLLLNLIKPCHSSNLDSEFECSFPMVVLPSDIDRSWHMNNAKYIRHLNFSRKALWRKLGIWQHVSKLGYTMVIGSQTIRYRKELALLDQYVIVSKVLCYVDSESSFYIESKFIKDKFVHAIHWAKYVPIRVRRDGNKTEKSTSMLPSQILMDCNVKGIEKLSVVPQEVVSWSTANSLSSKRLRLEGR